MQVMLGRKINSELHGNIRFINPFPNGKFSDSSKLKELTDDNFKFHENDSKFSKRVKNTVGKGEIARVLQTRKN